MSVLPAGSLVRLPEGAERALYLSLLEIHHILTGPMYDADRKVEETYLASALFAFREPRGVADLWYQTLRNIPEVTTLKAFLDRAEQEERLIYREPPEPLLSLKRANALLKRWGYPALSSIESGSELAEDAVLGYPLATRLYNLQIGPRVAIRTFGFYSATDPYAKPY